MTAIAKNLSNVSIRYSAIAEYNIYKNALSPKYLFFSSPIHWIFMFSVYIAMTIANTKPGLKLSKWNIFYPTNVVVLYNQLYHQIDQQNYFKVKNECQVTLSFGKIKTANRR